MKCRFPTVDMACICLQVLRTDIVMDLGDSLNPAIDVGQVEGGFMQGYGLFTLEEMVYSPTGTVYSRGPGVYKIPGFADIPIEFNVSLLKEAPNKHAVYSSKVSFLSDFWISRNSCVRCWLLSKFYKNPKNIQMFGNSAEENNYD